MPNFFSKVFKGKHDSDKADPLNRQFDQSELDNNPRYAIFEVLRQRKIPFVIWFDDVVRRYESPVGEAALPNVLCILLSEGAAGAMPGLDIIRGEPPIELQEKYEQTMLSPSFRLMRSGEAKKAYDEAALVANKNPNDADAMVKLMSLMSTEWDVISKSKDAYTSEQPLICLIPAEKFHYDVGKNPYRNVPPLPLFATGWMHRYILLPDGEFFQGGREAAVDYLQRLYTVAQLPDLKSSDFKKSMPKGFQQFHEDLLKNPDWNSLKKDGAGKKYLDIYKKYNK